MTYSTIRSKGRLIRADYEGGAYIELTFGSEGYTPTEVINVYDYSTGQPEQPFDDWDNLSALEARRAIREEVQAWIADQEKEWPEWYEGYIENARY